MMFRFGHATHPNWLSAVELVVLQLDGQLQLEQFASDKTRPFRLGVIYVTEHLAPYTGLILGVLRRKTGVTQWVGGVSTGICATGVEYFQEPALAVMLMELPADGARIFSGRLPLPKPGTLTSAGRDAMASALIHIDPRMEDTADLACDFATKVTSGQVFGGMVGAHTAVTHIANEPLMGGMSGVLFADNVTMEIRLTQGCQPVGPEHVLTRVKARFALELDNQPAMDVLLKDLGLNNASVNVTDDMMAAAAMLSERFGNGLFIGLRSATAAKQDALLRFAGVYPRSEDYRVKAVVGLDPTTRALAIAGHAEVGERLVFCLRNEAAVRADLVRLCAELRDELESPAPKLSNVLTAGFSGMKGQRRPRGAIYIACNGRGSALFGQQGAELEIIRQQLGDIPLVGFFANGEIRGEHVYSLSGILTLFF